MWWNVGHVPPPYEERRAEVWHAVKKVCAEVVEVLTGPARGFDARVVDAYGLIDTTVPLGHPATSLGVSLRRGDDKFHPWQAEVFLNHIRKFAMSTLCLPIFFAAKKKKSDATDVEGPHQFEDQGPAAKEEAEDRQAARHVCPRRQNRTHSPGSSESKRESTTSKKTPPESGSSRRGM